MTVTTAQPLVYQDFSRYKDESSDVVASWKSLCNAWDQVGGNRCAKPALQSDELFRLSHYAHTSLKAAPKGSKNVLFIRGKSIGLARNMIYDKAAKMAYIAAGCKESCFSGKGVHKKVTAAAGICLEEPTQKAEIVARVFSRKECGPTSIAALKHEAQVLTALKGLPGVVQLLAATHYEHPTMQKERVVLIMEAFVGDLFDAVLEKKLTPLNIMQVAKAMIYGLYGVHQKGYAHRDVKLENYLFRKEIPQTDSKAILEAHAIAKIADFETALLLMDETRAPCLHTVGATPGYTAPEMVGLKEFTGDLQRVDAFALGVSFYKMIEFKNNLWAEDIVAVMKQSQICARLEADAEKNLLKLEAAEEKTQAQQAYDESKAQLEAAISQYNIILFASRSAIIQKVIAVLDGLKELNGKVQEHKAKLQRGEKLSEGEQKECLQWLYKNLLAISPEDRFDLTRAKKEIDLFFPDFQIQ